MKPMIQTLSAGVALAAALWLAPAAHAGRSCEQRPLTLQALTQGLALAQQTAQALDAEFARSGARVVVLGRAGQDLSKYQLRYSHLGWAYKTDAGPWRVLHKLNACGTSMGALYRQGLGAFFLDGLWRFEAVWSVPAPQLQAWLGFKTYQPTTLRLGALTRLGASAGSAHIRFDDHPNDKRFSDRIETVTVDSVLDWLERTGLGGPAQRLAL